MELDSESGPRSRSRARWSLTPEAFERLLDRLAVDREEAAREFEDLRRYLTALLTYAGGLDPERLADVALDRAAKRLSEGERIDNLKAWLRGAARKVLQEARVEGNREASAARLAQVEPGATGRERDQRLLDGCLGRLPPESRSLIERYYQASNEPLLAARKRLARELGISVETLRTRALRLRKALERCFEERERQKEEK